jgi:hypothetical protein
MVELTQAVRASVGRQVASNGHNPLNFRLRDWKIMVEHVEEIWEELSERISFREGAAPSVPEFGVY